MKKWLIEELICPQCLDSEIVLDPDIHTETDDEIIEGRLVCPQCRQAYEIHEGIAVVVPEQTLPIIQVGATKTVTVVISEGINLEVKDAAIIN